MRWAEILPFAKLASCLIGMEACGTAHHWARELIKLGHTVELMPPAYVETLRQAREDRCRGCEAVTRPTMRFVAVETADQ